ncbi:MAG: hypothetical protein CFE21_08570 [Bacteroidetes bacterium B1(2017)]|nr:MAG: hypothetical protein CFE21_08570 [Bacteroidetes bacterium B1(2017)]
MKKLNLLLIAFVILAGTACKKDKTTDEPTPAEKICLVTSTTDSDSNTFIYTFDSQNRIIKNGAYNGPDSTITIYTYTGNKVVMASGIVEQTYFLNSYGFADSVYYIVDGYVDLLIVLTHNSEGLVTSQKVTGTVPQGEVNQIGTFEYLNGDLVKQTNNDGTTTSTVTLEYYLDKPNKSKRFEEATQFYNSSAHMLKKMTGDDGSFTSYTYEYDSEGKVTKETSVDETNTVSYQNFSWSCK